MTLILLTMLLAIMQATPPVPRQTSNGSTHPTKKIKENADKNQNPAKSFMPDDPQSAPSSKSGTEQKNGNQTESQDVTVSKLTPVSIHRDLADWVAYSFNLGLVLVGVGGVVAAFLTLLQIANQTGEIRRQVDLSIRKETPRVTINPLAFAVDEIPSGYMEVKYIVDWLCPTPAFAVKAEIGAFAEKEKIIPSPDGWKLLEDWDMVVKSKRIEKASFVQHLFPEKALAEIKAGIATLYFYASLEYRSVHLRDDQPSIKSEFFYKWIVDTPDSPESLLPDMSHWEQIKQEKKAN